MAARGCHARRAKKPAHAASMILPFGIVRGHGNEHADAARARPAAPVQRAATQQLRRRGAK
jgi:hypothetical protein